MTDDELTALALAAEPDLPLGPDAVPLVIHQSGSPQFLPAWYMPPVMARARPVGGGRWYSFSLRRSFWWMPSVFALPTGSWSRPDPGQCPCQTSFFPGSAGAGACPDIDPGLSGITVDLGQLLAENSKPSNAFTLDSSCATLLTPMSADVTLGSRNTHDSAIWESCWPRPAAIVANALTLLMLSSLSISRRNEPSAWLVTRAVLRPGTGP